MYRRICLCFLEDVQLIIWNLSAFLSGDRFDLSKGKELEDGLLRSRVFRNWVYVRFVRFNFQVVSRLKTCVMLKPV